MGTHRVDEKVEGRLWKYAVNRHLEEAGFFGKTFSEILDELLKEVGF